MPTKKDPSFELLEQKLDLFKDHFDGHMGTVGKTLERMDDRLDRVDVTLGKQQTTLDEHVKRTNLLEDKLEQERKDIADKLAAERKQTAEELEPLKVQSTQVKLLIKVGAAIAAAGGLGGAGFGIKQLIAAIFGGGGH